MLGLLGLFGALMASVVADADHGGDDDDKDEDAAQVPRQCLWVSGRILRQGYQ